MEHFKLVFGSGTSDLAKIRPLKNWPPPFPGSHRLLGTSIRGLEIHKGAGFLVFLFSVSWLGFIVARSSPHAHANTKENLFT